MNSKINIDKGKVEIIIDNKRYLPVSFRSFYPAAHTVHNFDTHGFSLFSIFPSGIKCSLNEPYSQFGEVWIGEKEYCWENLKTQIDMFIENAPNAKFSLMVHLDTRDWFLEQNKECVNSFHNLIQVAGWQKWRDSAAQFMCDMVDYVESEYPDRLFSVFLFAGSTCEWLIGKNIKDFNHNELHEKAFQEFTNEPLRAIPSAEDLTITTNGVFRDPIKQKDAIDYWIFHNEKLAETISWFAKVLKEHTENAYPVGVFYGYLMGLGDDIVSRGHNALLTILNDRNIDILFAPAQYGLRGLDSVSAAYVPLASLKLHKKLFWHEIDNTTHLVNENKYAKALQSYAHKRMENIQQTVMYSRRESALAMAHGCGYWWFDMFGGWYDDKLLMSELEKIKEVTASLWEKDMSSCSQIAVFTDTSSSYYTGSMGKINTSLVFKQVEELGRIGMPWDSYIADDIYNPDFNHSQYKLYLFLNIHHPSSEIIEAIKHLKDEKKSILFLYAPGYITDTGFSLSNMKKLTGFDFEYAPLDHIQFVSMPEQAITEGQTIEYGFLEKVSPAFTTNNGTILGYYSNTDIPAFVIDHDHDHFTAWSGAGAVPATVLRNIAVKAGCFAYTNQLDPVYINKSIFGLYAHKKGTRLVTFPEDVLLHELYTGEEIITKNRSVAIDYDDDHMKLFEIIKK